MAKKDQSSPKRPRSSKKNAIDAPLPTIKAVQATSAAGKLDPSTVENYKRRITTFREWIPRQLESMQSDTGELQDLLGGSSSLDASDVSPLESPTLGDAEQCLDHPNQLTPCIISLYYYYESVSRQNGESTLKAIQAALLWHFETIDPERFRASKEWAWNPTLPPAQRAQGSPVRARLVNKTYLGCMNEIAARSGPRKHARAMQKEDMDAIYLWSLQHCPDFNSVLKALTCGKLDESFLQNVTFHLFWRAYAAFSFILWTRNFESANLTWADINFDHQEWHGLKHMHVVLKNRKGWLSKATNDDHRHDQPGHHYNIYPVDDASIDAFRHISNWRYWYQHHLVPTAEAMRSFKVFPQISTTSFEVHVGTDLSPSASAALIAWFTSGAGLNHSGPCQFTTHTFRRGGAQYRFMHAPNTWPLEVVRYWGGWAENESHDVLLKYLLDDLAYAKHDHRDALAPIQRPLRNEASSVSKVYDPLSPLTLGAFQHFGQSLQQHISTCISSSISSLAGSLAGTHAHREQPSQGAFHKHPLSQSQSPPHSYNVSQHSLPPASSHWCSFLNNSCSPSLDLHSLAPAADTIPLAHYLPTHGSGSQLPQAHQQVALAPGVIPQAPPRIPDLFSGPRSWKKAWDHWFFPDPDVGLVVPLKDWPPEWLRGHKLDQSAKHGQRRIVAEQFQRFVEKYYGDINEATRAFEMRYSQGLEPGKPLTFSVALKAIRQEQNRFRKQPPNLSTFHSG
ncbi:hypothetical protein DL93DRAFT_2174273 [Clavulina sp. PMI_390]|nr:hypothetical protein DL93DRAFT_2174273 [Clavulina sp. PMI_390]